MQKSYERLKKQEGIPTVPKERRIRPIHIWQSAAAIFFLLLASSVLSIDCRHKSGNRLVTAIYSDSRKKFDAARQVWNKKCNSTRKVHFYIRRSLPEIVVVYSFKGEANFKVKPDKKRPFIVKSNDLQITALGTEFNVSAYPESSGNSNDPHFRQYPCRL